MEKMNFSTAINSSKEKVWQVLWSDAGYRKWTSVFCEGSHAITDNWIEGSKVLFMDPNGNGMVSTVVKNIPNEFMSFKHLGEVKNGMEDTTSEKVLAWAGAMENYTLEVKNGHIELSVEIDVNDSFKEYFNDTMPKALDKVKEIAETKSESVTVQALINAPVEKTWQCWTLPEHITKWNNASDDWHTTSAENDLRVGGKFSFRMEAKDGSMGFDFWGVYDEVLTNEKIAYTMVEGRKAKVIFASEGNSTKIMVTFEAESENPVEMQRGGWQAILDNFKKYSEAN